MSSRKSSHAEKGQPERRSKEKGETGGGVASNEPLSKRIIITDDIYLRSNKEFGRTVDLWRRLGLPVIADLIPPAGSPEESDYSPKANRLDKARRGIVKAKFLANRDFGAKFVLDDEVRNRIYSAVDRIKMTGVNISLEARGRFAWYTSFHMYRLITSEEQEGLDKSKEKQKLLKRVMDAIQELSHALEAMDEHKNVTELFDCEVGKEVRAALSRATIKILWEVEKEKAIDLKTLIYTGSALQLMDLFLSNSKSSSGEARCPSCCSSQNLRARGIRFRDVDCSWLASLHGPHA